MVTETDELSAGLDIAAGFWPHARESRSELLRLIISKGIEAIQDEADARRAERVADYGLGA